MPESMQSVSRLLAQRERELSEEVAAAQQRADANGHEVSDRKDEAGASALTLIGAAELERDLAELRAIAGARQRIEDGRYGQCDACGEAIGLERLLAQPTATRCTACQDAAERRGRRPG
jgi:RNA polymerase-binding protein DksA